MLLNAPDGIMISGGQRWGVRVGEGCMIGSVLRGWSVCRSHGADTFQVTGKWNNVIKCASVGSWSKSSISLFPWNFKTRFRSIKHFTSPVFIFVGDMRELVGWKKLMLANISDAIVSCATRSPPPFLLLSSNSLPLCCRGGVYYPNTILLLSVDHA